MQGALIALEGQYVVAAGLCDLSSHGFLAADGIDRDGDIPQIEQ